jgi:hypothetical protein
VIRRAHRGYENLTPFGRMLATTVPVVLMLSVALGGMCSRGDVAPPTAPAATATPIVVTADLALMLRSGPAEVALDAALVDAAAGASSTAHEMARFEVVGGVSTSASPTTSTHEEAFALAVESSPWPAHLWATLTEIARCESRFDPSQVGDSGRSLGVLQVHTPAWPHLERAFDLLDLGDNLAAGWIIYVEAGRTFAPWSCWDGGL